MSRQLIKYFLLINILIIGITAEYYDDYKSTDVDERDNLLQLLLRNYIEKSRGHRELDNNDEWTGRWMPDRPSDPKPHPKIFHNNLNAQDNFEKNPSDSGNIESWTGRWMPDRPSDPKPPPKIFHNNLKAQDNFEKNPSDSGNIESWTGRWMPDRPSDPKPPPKIFHHNLKAQDNFEANPSDSENIESWTGRWMPDRPSDPKPPPKIPHAHQSPDMVPMGVLSHSCDDGKTNLTVDWDNSPVNYTCYERKEDPDVDLVPQMYCEQIPKKYRAIHKCMNEVIEYDDDLPLYGTHRPIWAVYGEYKFLPRQRWLHNLEHGAIVMLYHPCAHPAEVKELKRLVTGCIRRHVISPSNFLTYERPLALMAWGCRLTMSYVDPDIVQEFIMQYALKAPEPVYDDGNFNEALIKKAEIVSDITDSILCPKKLQN